MEPTIEQRQILESLKRILKQKGVRYRDLSQKLDLSLPSVKRMFSLGEISLNRLTRICEILDISLADLIEYQAIHETVPERFSEQQERYFSEYPSYLAYLFQLARNKSPLNIEGDFKISRKSTIRYLKKLEGMGLIRRDSLEDVKVLIKKRTRWENDGALAQCFSKSMISAFSKRAVNSLSQKGGLTLHLGGLRLGEDQRKAFQRDIKEVKDRYSRISDLNSRVGDPLAMDYVSYMFIEDAWEDPMFITVTDL